MDWELYERYRATVLLAVVAVFSFLLLAFQKTAVVKSLRVFLVHTTLPPQRVLSHARAPAAVNVSESGPSQASSEADLDARLAEASLHAEQRRLFQSVLDENSRLRGALDLKERRWTRAVVAHVAGRDPQRWFQEIVLDKGKDHGIAVDQPVVAIAGEQEALVGRITEVSARVAKAMLLQDPLSAVAATIEGVEGDDGIVEGTNRHELAFKFLDRGSRVKIGDLVVTSGLGADFPAGIPIGWVRDIGLDPRQLFLQATLKPAARSNQLRVVLVLVGGPRP